MERRAQPKVHPFFTKHQQNVANTCERNVHWDLPNTDDVAEGHSRYELNETPDQRQISSIKIYIVYIICSSLQYSTKIRSWYPGTTWYWHTKPHPEPTYLPQKNPLFNKILASTLDLLSRGRQ
jgi:hypothetical protein